MEGNVVVECLQESITLKVLYLTVALYFELHAVRLRKVSGKERMCGG